MRRRVLLVLSLAALAITTGWFMVDPGPEPFVTALLIAGGLVSIGLRGESPPESRAQAPAEAGTLAVLPFQNLGDSKEDEYFADGVTEEIINTLGGTATLRVTARTSAFSFKDTSLEVREIGRRLAVANALEGTLRRVEDTIRITTQLVDVESGYVLWGERYDTSLDDILGVQTDIALSIVSKLASTDSAETRSALPSSRHSSRPEAYDAYLRGRFHWNKHTHPALLRALSHFERATELDPEYAMAHSGIAASLFWLGFLESMEPGQAYPRVKEAAARALAIDPSVAEAHTYLGSALMVWDWDWRGAELELRRGLDLDPNSVLARQMYGVYLGNLGRFDEALAQNAAALALDPFWPKLLQDRGYLLTLQGHSEDALIELDRALEFDRDFPVTHLCRGFALLQLGRASEAVPAFEKGVELSGGGPMYQACLGFGYAFADDHARAEQILGRLLNLRERSYVPAALLAWVHIGLGDVDAAFDWIDAAVTERSAMLLSVRTFLFWDPIRDDSRFTRLLETMRLDPVMSPDRPRLLREKKAGSSPSSA